MKETGMPLPESAFITTGLLDGIFAEIKDDWTQRSIVDDKRIAVVLVVLDPVKPIGAVSEPVVLWTATLGENDRAKWPTNRNWDKYAFAKARAAWRTRMSNHDMLINPEAVAKEDFKYQGGIYIPGGLVIAVSGLAKAIEDTALAHEFSLKIRDKVSTLIKENLRKIDPDDDATFFF